MHTNLCAPKYLLERLVLFSAFGAFGAFGTFGANFFDEYFIT